LTLSSQPEETKATEKGIDDARKEYLTQERLVQETIEIIRMHFEPSVRMIKERIEWAITNVSGIRFEWSNLIFHKEYLERDAENQKLFRYLA
jgi:hypothetical protein